MEFDSKTECEYCEYKGTKEGLKKVKIASRLELDDHKNAVHLFLRRKIDIPFVQHLPS